MDIYGQYICLQWNAHKTLEHQRQWITNHVPQCIGMQPFSNSSELPTISCFHINSRRYLKLFKSHRVVDKQTQPVMKTIPPHYVIDVRVVTRSQELHVRTSRQRGVGDGNQITRVTCPYLKRRWSWWVGRRRLVVTWSKVTQIYSQMTTDTALCATTSTMNMVKCHPRNSLSLAIPPWVSAMSTSDSWE